MSDWAWAAIAAGGYAAGVYPAGRVLRSQRRRPPGDSIDLALAALAWPFLAVALAVMVALMALGDLLEGKR